MATYYADKVVLDSQGRNTVMPKWFENRDATVLATFVVGNTVTLGTGDTVQLFDLPANVKITGFVIDSDKIDSGTTLVFKVGDAALTTRYGAGYTYGQAGGSGIQNAGGIIGYVVPNTAPFTRVFLTPTVAATGAPAAGTAIRVEIKYNSDS